jgi:hypothetical protein
VWVGIVQFLEHIFVLKNIFFQKLFSPKNNTGFEQRVAPTLSAVLLRYLAKYLGAGYKGQKTSNYFYYQMGGTSIN